MEIYCERNEFTHIKIMAESIFGENKQYGNCVLVFGYNVVDGGIDTIKELYPNKKIIVYQLEQLYGGNKWASRSNIEFLRRADYVWDYDHQNIEFTRNFGIDSMFVPILYAPELTTLPILKRDEHDIDILFYGSLNEHRLSVIDSVKKLIPKANIVCTDRLWGDELDDHIQRSKIILNIHYYPINRQEQARLFYLMANHKCIVSEESAINYYGNGIVECKAHDIAKVCNSLLLSGDWYNYAKRSLQKLITSNTRLVKGT